MRSPCTHPSPFGPNADRRLLLVFEAVRSSTWIVPTLFALGGLLLARLVVVLDRTLEWEDSPFAFLFFTGDLATGRMLLSALASSTISVLAMVFSITIVALTFASSQLGPRLLTIFREDRVNQAALGAFLGSYVYNLTVLSDVSEGAEVGYRPGLSVTVGLLLAGGSFCILLLFVQRLATALQSDRMITRVGDELDDSLEQWFPERTSESSDRSVAAPPPTGARLAARKSGYIQAIDYAHLEQVATEHDVLVVVELRAGLHVLKGAPVLSLAREVDHEVEHALLESIVIGSRRTRSQDAEFGLRQLVEISLRALSPGINDPFTALAVIDRIAASLACLHGRATPAWARRGDSGRVIARALTFEDLMDAAWNPLRLHGGAQTAVTIRLLETYAALCRIADTGSRAASVREHARRTLEQFAASQPLPFDLDEARARAAGVERALFLGPGARPSETRTAPVLLAGGTR